MPAGGQDQATVPQQPAVHPPQPVFVGMCGTCPMLLKEDLEDWSIFKEKLEFYFEANNISEERRKRAILFANTGDIVYKSVRKLCDTATVTYTGAIEVLDKHFRPRLNPLISCNIFRRRVQQPTESFKDFVAELRLLARDCEFTDVNHELLHQMLIGMRDSRLQETLLATEGLDCHKVYDRAVASELAKANQATLRASSLPTDSSSVHKASQQYIGSKRRGGQRAPAVVSSSKRPCECCGDSDHGKNTCPYATYKCNYCKQVGHLLRVCRKKAAKDQAGTRPNEPSRASSRGRGRGGSQLKQLQATQQARPADAHQVSEPVSRSSVYDVSGLFNVNNLKGVPPPFLVNVQVDNADICMEIDSGAGHSIIGSDVFEAYFSTASLQPPDLVLQTWSKERLHVKGVFTPSVTFGERTAPLPLAVMDRPGPALMGRSWFDALGISVDGIFATGPVTVSNSVPTYLHDLKEVFKPELGKYIGPPAHIHIKADAVPVFRKARPVPFALRQKVSDELDRMVAQGILVPVTHSVWATPTVNVVKRDGSIRICGDYSVTVNQHCVREVYPLPTTDELLSRLNGGKLFSKIDLSQAFMQVSVDKETSQVLTLNTHRGLFRMTRLTPGLSSAPAYFQRLSESLLVGIDGVIVFMDDVLIMAENEFQLQERVRQVIKRLLEAGLRLRLDKCVFSSPTLDYVGYSLSAEGIKPSQSKVQELLDTPSPSSLEELQAFLGYVNYYDRFFPDKATKFHALYSLLQSKSSGSWHWGEAEEECVRYAHAVMTSDAVLMHFNPKLPIVIFADASPYGVGAVLAHQVSPMEDRPIAFASRTLRVSERNYSQLDREGLAVIFAIKKFHMYVYGREFTIVTDNKPLCGIFRSDKPIPEVTSPRMLRWCLMLANYQYTIKHRPGKQHGNADFLSRLPSSTSMDIEYPDPADILLFEQAPSSSPLTSAEVAKATAQDPSLSQVLSHVVHGRSAPKDDEVQAYLKHNHGHLSVMNGCVLRGSRVVIPPVLRPQVLSLLHKVHQGIVRTKALARSYVWWPGISEDIETLVKSCSSCALVQRDPCRAPVQSWPQPDKVWSRLHLDYAGPFHGHTFLICVDAKSKWIEVASTSGSMSSATTIAHLRSWFATHGIPEQLVTDNGPAFASSEFGNFCNGTGIKHTKSAPYKPSTNGQAERTVQTVKSFLKKLSPTSWKHELAAILLMLHATPSTATGVAPCEMLMGRRIRSLIDKLHPASAPSGGRRPVDHEPAPGRSFAVGESILFRSYSPGDKWVPGFIISVDGTRYYRVITTDGDIERRHIDQIVRRHVGFPSALPSAPSCSKVPVAAEAPPTMGKPEIAAEDPPIMGNPEPTVGNQPVTPEVYLEAPFPRVPSPGQAAERLRPQRVRNPPARLQDYVTKY